MLKNDKFIYTIFPENQRNNYAIFCRHTAKHSQIWTKFCSCLAGSAATFSQKMAKNKSLNELKSGILVTFPGPPPYDPQCPHPSRSGSFHCTLPSTAWSTRGTLFFYCTSRQCRKGSAPRVSIACYVLTMTLKMRWCCFLIRQSARTILPTVPPLPRYSFGGGAPSTAR